MGGIPPWILYIPWALSVLFFGLPHGACDHVIWASLRGRPLRFLPVLSGYVAVMALYALLWYFLPALSAAVFVAMTIWHWGSADATRSFKRAGALWPRALWFLGSLFRGILPMLAPAVLYADVVLSIVAGWSPGIDQADLMAMMPAGYWLALIVFAAQVGWLMVMHRIGAPIKEELGETMLLTVLLTAVHPLVSVGIYFTFWHAWYHDRRLRLWYESTTIGLADRSKRRDQVIIMIITLLGLGALLYLLPPGRSTLSVYLVAISIMTMPHMIVVWLMDGRESTFLSTAPVQTP